MSASIGIALYPQHGTDGISLARVADNAMYQAKREGSNRFSVAD
ncbi:MAG: diguanylate cyclase [Pseudomonadota bacterium]